jgi:hypothetical protein
VLGKQTAVSPSPILDVTNFLPLPGSTLLCSRGFDEESAGCGELAIEGGCEGPPPNSAAKTSNKQRQKKQEVFASPAIACLEGSRSARSLACPACLPSPTLHGSPPASEPSSTPYPTRHSRRRGCSKGVLSCSSRRPAQRPRIKTQPPTPPTPTPACPPLPAGPSLVHSRILHPGLPLGALFLERTDLLVFPDPRVVRKAVLAGR